MYILWISICNQTVTCSSLSKSTHIVIQLWYFTLFSFISHISGGRGVLNTTFFSVNLCYWCEIVTRCRLTTHAIHTYKEIKIYMPIRHNSFHKVKWHGIINTQKRRCRKSWEPAKVCFSARCLCSVLLVPLRYIRSTPPANTPFLPKSIQMFKQTNRLDIDKLTLVTSLLLSLLHCGIL